MQGPSSLPVSGTSCHMICTGSMTVPYNGIKPLNEDLMNWAFHCRTFRLWASKSLSLEMKLTFRTPIITKEQHFKRFIENQVQTKQDGEDGEEGRQEAFSLESNILCCLCVKTRSCRHLCLMCKQKEKNRDLLCQQRELTPASIDWHVFFSPSRKKDQRSHSSSGLFRFQELESTE